MTEANTVLSEEQIAEIEARADAATDGWYVEGERDAVRYGFRIYDKYQQGVCKMTSGGEFHDRPHSAFISHAREDIPALCQTVKALRAQLAEEVERANDNFTAYDRVKGYYSGTVNRLSEVERELKITRQHRDDLIAELEPKK